MKKEKYLKALGVLCVSEGKILFYISVQVIVNIMSFIAVS
jgi:hypothetical protein